ncbi:hypothetical protein [Pseudosulfitobacter koreensis]|uniref:Uncharacterized protein n=1 Tax=Pseudosulfitobacter koreensis TaxID=2968472 RepID=A0ABT1Z4J0_9RHOB|nr:hypothetical protein [Pseudosulfitobacter koreense]MCR8828023.1 hypothetical protein [Pseudosulfitobacter koreense]
MKDHLSRERAAQTGHPAHTTAIKGFDPAEDVLLIPAPAGTTGAIIQQRITKAGLTITFSTGDSVLLEGVYARIGADAVSFVAQGDAQPDVQPDMSPDPQPDAQPDQQPDMSPDTQPSPPHVLVTPPPATPPSDEVVYFGSYTSGDGDAHSYMGIRADHQPDPQPDAHPDPNPADHTTLTDFIPGTDVILIETDAPQALHVADQTLTDQGLRITLSNGVTITLQGVKAPLDDADICFVPEGTDLP